MVSVWCLCVVGVWVGEKVGEWREEENCVLSTLFLFVHPANTAEEEVAKLVVINDSGMCKASFAGDVCKERDI